MRTLLSNAMTASVMAGALLVSACGGGSSEEANNTAMTDLNATDTMMDGSTNDITAIDAATEADANMTMDANMGADAGAGANASANATTGTTDANLTNGM